jgi:hypothetical protein
MFGRLSVATCGQIGFAVGTEILSERGPVQIESISEGMSLRISDPTNPADVEIRRVGIIEVIEACELWALRLSRGRPGKSSYSLIVSSSSLRCWLSGFEEGIEEFIDGSVTVFPEPPRWINLCDLQTALIEGSTPLLALAGGDVARVLDVYRLLRTDNPHYGALDDPSLENGFVTIVSVGDGSPRWVGGAHLIESDKRVNIARGGAQELLPFVAPVYGLGIGGGGGVCVGGFGVLANTRAEG